LTAYARKAWNRLLNDMIGWPTLGAGCVKHQERVRSCLPDFEFAESYHNYAMPSYVHPLFRLFQNWSGLILIVDSYKHKMWLCAMRWPAITTEQETFQKSVISRITPSKMILVNPPHFCLVFFFNFIILIVGHPLHARALTVPGPPGRCCR
jgi:hypothetical protein